MVTVKNIVNVALGMTVFFLLMSTIVLSHFNTVYNFSITGLGAATTQGLFLLVLVLAIIGVGMSVMPGGKK